MKATRLALAALTAITMGASTLAADIGILCNGDGKHNDEFDSSLADFGITPRKFKDKPEELAEFAKALDGFSLIMSAPLFAYPKKSALETEPLLKWVENGGLLVITDGAYEGVRQTFDPIGGGSAKLTTGKCTSSPWAVKGYVENENPTHPLRCFPNKATNGDTWCHFEESAKDSGWQVLTRCSEGKPVVLFRNVGKGGVFLTVLRTGSVKEIENFLAYSALKRSGLELESFELSPLMPGIGHLDVRLSSDPPAESVFAYDVEIGGQKTRLAEVPVKGKAAKSDFRVSVRGDAVATMTLRQGKDEIVLFKRKSVIPRLMEVYPNDYRGILSSGRRGTGVKFPVKLAPDSEDLAGATLLLEAFSGTNRVAKAEHRIAKDVPACEWYNLQIGESWRTKVGEYRLVATLTKPDGGIDNGPISATSETSYEILAARPAQCVIDEDRTFLVNGKPYFPLGIYHISPLFYERAREIGFNTVQFWAWHLVPDAYGAPWGMHKAIGSGLRFLFEPNHGGESALRGNAAAVKDNPAMLMYYVADEPAENAEKALKARNDLWHEIDKHHPTFVASCRDDLYAYHSEFADVFAIDPYCDEDLFIKKCRKAQETVGHHKPLVVVPWADMSDELIVQQAWTALAHDARGIIWYCWNQAGGGPKGEGIHDKPEKQEVFAKLLPQINSMLGPLVEPSRRPFEEGPVHGIVLGAGRWGQHGLIFVNTTTNEVAFKMELPELKNVEKVSVMTAEKVDGKDKNGKDIKVAPTLPIVDGLIDVTLKPAEGVAWRW